MRGHSLVLPRAESSTIMGLDAAGRKKELVQDATTLMRVLELALVLNDRETCSADELEKLQTINAKLKIEVLRIETVFNDYKGKYKI